MLARAVLALAPWLRINYVGCCAAQGDKASAVYANVTETIVLILPMHSGCANGSSEVEFYCCYVASMGRY